jgi:hypothetical protein
MEDTKDRDDPLFISFRGRHVPITFTDPPVTRELAERAVACPVFRRWVSRCRDREQRDEEGKLIEIRGVEIQSIDLFGPRYSTLEGVPIVGEYRHL